MWVSSGRRESDISLFSRVGIQQMILKSEKTRSSEMSSLFRNVEISNTRTKSYTAKKVLGVVSSGKRATGGREERLPLFLVNH